MPFSCIKIIDFIFDLWYNIYEYTLIRTSFYGGWK